MFRNNNIDRKISQSSDPRLPGEIWSDHITNLKTSANAAGVVSRHAARFANERPEDFQLIMGGAESAPQQVEPSAEHLGEVATEHMVKS